MGLSAMAQTMTVTGTIYHPGGRLSWRTASGDKIDNEKLKKREIKWMAVTKDILDAGFKMNDTVVVECESAPQLNGKWVIKDRMSRRLRKKVDFLVARGDSYGMHGRTSLTISKVK